MGGIGEKENSQLSNSISEPFKIVKDPFVLLPIIQSRLPASALMHNAIKISNRFPAKENGFFTLFGRVDESSWILYKYYAEDGSYIYLISADSKTSTIQMDDVVESFDGSKIICWDKPFFFYSVPKWIVPAILEITTNRRGNRTIIHPAALFYAEKQTCSCAMNDGQKTAKITCMDPESGTAFLINSWQHATPKLESEFNKIIQRNETACVIENGKIVCGTICNPVGMLSALHTLPEARRKGYAVACVDFIRQQLFENGLIPTNLVELKNEAGLKFHEKLRSKRAQDVMIIIHKPYN